MPDESFTDAGESFATSQMVRDWLRKPFKPEQIGKLPATAKRPALDFVGHAAVTDRLNKIAPDWHYTIDNMSTAGETVWIRGTMIIGGIARPEFGDGADPKSAIGNFIRRGAMRFGVGLDLWSREELEESAPVTTRDQGAAGPGEGVLTPSPGHQASPVVDGEVGDRPSHTRQGPAGGTTSTEGEAVVGKEPGEAVQSSLSASPGSPTKDAPGPPHYPLRPDECSHRNERTGHLLRPRKSPRGPVCPRCGLNYITVTESTAADLGAA